MTAITVRAPSGHKAMEEILQRLGPDALILSTRHVDGKIEITALPPDGFVAPEVEEGPSEEELFAEALRTRAPLFAAPPARPFAKPAPRPPSAAAAPREPAFTARPIAPAAAAVAPKPAAPAAAAPKAPAPRPAAPAAPPAPMAAPARPAAARAEAQDFAEALRQETRRPAPSVDPLDQLARQLFRPEALADEPVARIILAGPSGAGKSMLAARLAARLMLDEPGLRPQIIAPVPAAMLVEDRLRGWCRLMGLMPDRPTLAAAMNLPDPAPNAPQIIDLSDIPDAAPELAARLIDVDDAELVLCLPAGLHPARVARICHDWQAYDPTVTLTGLDHWWPERDELEAIAQSGLKLTRIASGTGLLDALSRPGVTDLRNWATGWAPHGARLPNDPFYRPFHERARMMLAKRYAEQDGPSPEKLVRSHMDLVRKIAWHLHGRVGRMVEIEDMLQVGYMGLVDAAQRYTPRQGASFAAYAAIRIRGSIIDYLRASSSLCRATIVMQQKMRASVLKLEQQLLRAPEKQEIAADMGITVGELEDWQAQFGASQIKSLDEVYSDHSMLFSDSGRSVEDKMQQDQMRKMLRRALGELPEREALVLQLYFVEELNVYEIAEILGVTTGRVSQIKKAAVGRLRDCITAMENG